MNSSHAVIFAAAALLTAPAGAAPAPPADHQAEPSTKPISQREPNAVDVVATPVTDLNLRKGEIPPVLLAAQDAPYALSGMKRCPQIAAEIGRLDGALGDDIDIAQDQGRHISPGKVAQSVIGGFIPFRGIIREISGANEQERRVQTAIYAGSVRRSFLKGIGQQRGCPWPARSATPAVLAKIALANEAKASAKQDAEAARDDDRKGADEPAGKRPRR